MSLFLVVYHSSLLKEQFLYCAVLHSTLLSFVLGIPMTVISATFRRPGFCISKAFEYHQSLLKVVLSRFWTLSFALLPRLSTSLV